MNIDYKYQIDDKPSSNNQLTLENAAIRDESCNELLDRSSLFIDSIILDLTINLESENINIEVVSNLIDILCSITNRLFDFTTLIDFHFCSYLIENFPQSPIFVSNVFKNILICSSAYDDFFVSQKHILSDIMIESINDALTSNMLSIIATMASRHPELMIEFINPLYTKKITIDSAQFVYSIIPVAQQLIQDIDDYFKVAHLISQIIICSDFDVILVGIKILTRAIECNDTFLMHSFGQSQLQYESLLYYSEVKKIAAGYRALTITMPCIKNRNECINNASNIIQMAEKHIKLIPNVLKQSIIQYACQYSKFTKNCFSQNLFLEILQIASNGSFYVRIDAVNCIAISIIETKRKIDDISYLTDVFSAHLGGNIDVVLNIIQALNVIFDYAQIENNTSSFCLIVLSNFDFNELINNDSREIHDAAQLFLDKITEAQGF